MNLALQEILLKEARHFSPLSYAGGVTFEGPEPISDGAFCVDLHQPDYQFLNRNYPHSITKLSFKKSVFFYQNLLVCLGSNLPYRKQSGTNNAFSGQVAEREFSSSPG